MVAFYLINNRSFGSAGYFFSSFFVLSKSTFHHHRRQSVVRVNSEKLVASSVTDWQFAIIAEFYVVYLNVPVVSVLTSLCC